MEVLDSACEGEGNELAVFPLRIRGLAAQGCGLQESEALSLEKRLVLPGLRDSLVSRSREMDRTQKLEGTCQQLELLRR